MKRIFWLFSLVLCFSVSTFAQNWYVNTQFGIDYMTNERNVFTSYNNVFNGQIGYYFTPQSAVEFDYSHGFEKELYDVCDVSYNRIGFNYLFECPTSLAVAPFFKSGFGYRLYNLDSYKETDNYFYGDIKLGIGAHCYLSEDVTLNFGIDAYYMFNDYSYQFKDTFSFQPYVGVGFNF